MLQHDGYIDLSDVDGMLAKDGSGKSINDVVRVKIKTCTKKVTQIVQRASMCSSMSSCVWFEVIVYNIIDSTVLTRRCSDADG